MTLTSNLQNLVVDAVDVVEFKLIRKREDVDCEDIAFPPAMAHQIFGENENIFGYKDLQVRLMYTAGPLDIYVGIKYQQRIDDYLSDGLKADDVVGIIASKLPDGCYYTNIDEFLKTLAKSETFKPFGEKRCEYKLQDSFGVDRHFEIYQCDMIDNKFSKFFERLQTFVLWFVDAASYIDIDDPQWTFFICYEKYKELDGNYHYATVGYTTVYKYYAYPENMRPRISQMMILPPFQKLGIGAKFIETIYQYFIGDSKVIDITVEDPSDEFQRIRNYVDAKLCKDLPAFSPTVIKNGFTKDMVKEAREKYKINPRQCRKVYEILRLMHTNIHNEKEYRELRLDIKKRLNLVYFKQLRDIEKMTKVGVDTQWMTATLPSKEERLEQLHKEYKELESYYEKIIKRLKNPWN